MSRVQPDASAPPGMHGPCLATGLIIMIGGSVWPFMMADRLGRADHVLALALMWAMSAGLVRGIGFVPRRRWARLIWSAPACTAALALAALRWTQI